MSIYMKPVNTIIRFRKKRKRKPTLIPGFSSALGISLLLAIGVIVAAFLFTRVAADLPNPERLMQGMNPYSGEFLQPSILLDRSGEVVLYRFHPPGIEERGNIRLSGQAALPEQVYMAFTAAADPYYWKRTTADLLDWRQKGDPAISRRLVSDFLFWKEQDGLVQVLRESLVAAQLVSLYGKEQILEWHLNSLNFGHQAYGLETASRLYFGKNARDLNVAEAALLAVVGEAPALNPFDAPQAARERQTELLHTMLKMGILSAEEAQQALATPLFFQEAPGNLAQEPRYVDWVVDQVAEIIPEDRFRRGGFQVVTSLDADLQEQMNCLLEYQRELLEDPERKIDSRCEAARLLPAAVAEMTALSQDLSIQSLILDHTSGELLAVAGIGPEGSEPSWTPGHAPGSILTPFLYLAAFTRGGEPAALVWDIPPDPPLPVEDTHPQCRQDCQYQGPVRMRIALANDYLSPAYQTWEKIGASGVLNIFRQLGFSTIDPSCLGCQWWWEGQLITLPDTARAYGILANQGNLVGWSGENGAEGSLRPVIIRSIETHSGNSWLDAPKSGSQAVISRELAYLVTDALADETARWPSLGAQNVFEIGRPAAVKMGWVEGEQSHWTAGYTPQRTAVVWVSLPDNPSGGLARISSGVWRALMQYASRDLPSLDWEVPQGITKMEVCDPSGMLPTENCPRVVSEVFLYGSEPTRYDNLYQVRQVNRDTGLLATVFTPPELIEERVYLIAPPEASEWISAQGLAAPPEQYDTAYAPRYSSSASLTSPENFQFVRGTVPIRGTIRGDDLVAYYLQVGQGLNPSAWIRSGEEKTRPSINSLITDWDTTSLEDGVYALQVVVLRENQRVEKITVLVSVDNTPPVLEIPGLVDGEILEYRAGAEMTFLAAVSDNAEIAEVKFYLDGRWLGDRVNPPFAVTWPKQRGSFTLRVLAVDMAGNTTEQEIRFSVRN